MSSIRKPPSVIQRLTTTPHNDMTRLNIQKYSEHVNCIIEPIRLDMKNEIQDIADSKNHIVTELKLEQKTTKKKKKIAKKE